MEDGEDGFKCLKLLNESVSSYSIYYMCQALCLGPGNAKEQKAKKNPEPGVYIVQKILINHALIDVQL